MGNTGVCPWSYVSVAKLTKAVGRNPTIVGLSPTGYSKI